MADAFFAGAFASSGFPAFAPSDFLTAFLGPSALADAFFAVFLAPSALAAAFLAGAFFAGAFASSGFAADFAVRLLAGAFLAAGFLAPALPVAAAWEALSAVTSGDSLSLGREALTRVPFIDGWGRLSLLAARPFDYN
ncbi:hypothetical protein HMPREF1550_00613 [Actinomyces sp. oral taxon 877 str. F0543]|nr:hypothetical protein HMPREF1550_00613 [Actinomyces sp. oral taxon 877 str. F0543]